MLLRVEKSLTSCREQFYETTQTEEWTDGPVAQKNKISKKKYKKNFEILPKHYMDANQWISFCKKYWTSSKNNFELELTKFVVCFLDIPGIYYSNLVAFKIGVL